MNRQKSHQDGGSDPFLVECLCCDRVYWARPHGEQHVVLEDGPANGLSCRLAKHQILEIGLDCAVFLAVDDTSQNFDLVDNHVRANNTQRPSWRPSASKHLLATRSVAAR